MATAPTPASAHGTTSPTEKYFDWTATPTSPVAVAVAPPRVARRLRRAVGLPERDGLLVRSVEDDSPAAGAGIERGCEGFAASRYAHTREIPERKEHPWPTTHARTCPTTSRTAWTT